MSLFWRRIAPRLSPRNIGCYRYNHARALFDGSAYRPIMDAVAIRHELLAAHPGVPQAIDRGFCDPKELAIEDVFAAELLET